MTESDPDAGLRGAIHWKSLRAALPHTGVEAAFPNEESCRARFVEVRWQAGPTCPRCGSAASTEILTRNLWQCNSCRYQYTATVQTSLHRSRVGMLQWFLAAEAVILARDLSLGRQEIPAQELAGVIGVSYVTAIRVRALVGEDLSPGGEGLLKSSICIRSVRAPADLQLGSLDHLRWLGGLS